MTKEINFSKYSSIKIGPILNVFLIDEIVSQPKDTFLIGGVNNLLISNRPPPLAMLCEKFDYIKIEENRLIIGGASKSGKIASFCKKNNISGFEYLAKLPGTLGGLIKMNAGMKEDEIFNSLLQIKTVNGILDKKDIAHGYRYTDINTIIYEAIFKINYGFDAKKLEVFSNMRLNQPNIPSVGSAFKNPKGDFAGRLIEAVGLKGYKKGGAGFSKLHANFLVNNGGASFDDAVYLLNLAQSRVLEKFNILLELEVKIV